MTRDQLQKNTVNNSVFEKEMDRRDFLQATTKIAGLTLGLTVANSLNSFGVKTTWANVSDKYASEKVPTMTCHVLSDIQGDLNDFKKTLLDLNEVRPHTDAMVINGDITGRGYAFEYEQVRQVLAQYPHPEKTYYTIGNHEFYTAKWKDPNTLAQATWPNGVPESQHFQNFYNFTGLDKVYYKREVNGYPFIFLGTEKYMHYHDPKMWDEVWMSNEQINFLKDNLEYYNRLNKNKPIFVFSHHILPDTVSGSRQSPYLADYLQADKLFDIFKDYPQVVLFTSHTHWDLNLPDWAAKKTIKGGDPIGFTIVNTGAMETGWMSVGPQGGEKVSPDGSSFNQGLYLEVFGNDVVIKARDFKRKQWIKELHIHKGLATQGAPEVTADLNQNILAGATSYMEYSVGNKHNWQTYNPVQLPKFAENEVVYVRHKGFELLEAGQPAKVKFSKK